MVWKPVRFYSTLVRLKVHFAASTSFVQKGFYSTLVRLKGPKILDI